MKPLIGLTTYYVKAHEQGEKRVRGMIDQDMLMSTMDYSQSIQKAGGVPVAIPLIMDDEYIESIVDKMDGFLFTGGADVYPLRYKEELHKNLGGVNIKRDDFELKLLDAAIKKGKPILGICRGCQLINVYFGGSLYQDIYSDLDTSLKHVSTGLAKHALSHKITIEEDTNLMNAFKCNEIWVNSLHHQAIKNLGEGLVKVAQATDGIIEAIEHSEHDFLVGVQWHPEMMAEVHNQHLNIFKTLINKCR